MKKLKKDIWRENFGSVKKQGFHGKGLVERTEGPIRREIRDNRGTFNVSKTNGSGSR